MGNNKIPPSPTRDPHPLTDHQKIAKDDDDTGDCYECAKSGANLATGTPG